MLQKKDKISKVNCGALMIGALESELVRITTIASRTASEPIEIPKVILEDKEILYFLDLEERSKRFQLRQEDEKASTTQSPFLAPKTLNKSLAQISAAIFTGDGSFLTNEFVSKHLAIEV
jgi:hypothetical protein